MQKTKTKNVCVYGNENEHVTQCNLWLIGVFLIYIFLENKWSLWHRWINCIRFWLKRQNLCEWCRLIQHKSSVWCRVPQPISGWRPPVTDPLSIIVLLSFVWISKSLDVQQWSQMIHLDQALIKAVIWDTFVFCLSSQCHEPKHERGSFHHIWYSSDSRLGSGRSYREIWVNLLSMRPQGLPPSLLTSSKTTRFVVGGKTCRMRPLQCPWAFLCSDCHLH